MNKNLTEIEKKIAKEAGQRGGAYLDKIKKYDVRTLSDIEWQTFIQEICYCDFLPF